jgi:hypothetical protein
MKQNLWNWSNLENSGLSVLVVNQTIRKKNTVTIIKKYICYLILGKGNSGYLGTITIRQ